jgi:hypothetical protein
MGRLLGTVLIVLGAPLAALGSAADQPAVETKAVEPGLLEFLAEESGVDEDMSGALMSSDLDRALARATRDGKVKDHDEDQ